MECSLFIEFPKNSRDERCVYDGMARCSKVTRSRKDGGLSEHCSRSSNVWKASGVLIGVVVPTAVGLSDRPTGQ